MFIECKQVTECNIPRIPNIKASIQSLAFPACALPPAEMQLSQTFTPVQTAAACCGRQTHQTTPYCSCSTLHCSQYPPTAVLLLPHHLLLHCYLHMNVHFGVCFAAQHPLYTQEGCESLHGPLPPLLLGHCQ